MVSELSILEDRCSSFLPRPQAAVRPPPLPTIHVDLLQLTDLCLLQPSASSGDSKSFPLTTTDYTPTDLAIYQIHHHRKEKSVSKFFAVKSKLKPTLNKSTPTPESKYWKSFKPSNQSPTQALFGSITSLSFSSHLRFSSVLPHLLQLLLNSVTPLIYYWRFLATDMFDFLPLQVFSDVPIKILSGNKSIIICFKWYLCVLVALLFLGFGRVGFCDDFSTVSVPLGFQIFGVDRGSDLVSENGVFALGFLKRDGAGVDDGFLVGVRYNIGTKTGFRVSLNSTFKLDMDGYAKLKVTYSMRYPAALMSIAYSPDCSTRVIGACGLYSVCGFNSSGPVCDCLFWDTNEWATGDPATDFGNSGCKKMIDLSNCKMRTSKQYMYGLYPPHDVIMMLGQEACKAYCSNYTTCIAATSVNDGSGLCTVKRTSFISGYQTPSVPSTSVLKACCLACIVKLIE